MKKIIIFLIGWLIVLLANQIFFFGSCFNFRCILSALPHTFAISAILFFIFSIKPKNRKSEEKPKNKQCTQSTNTQPRKQTKAKTRYTKPPRPKTINQQKGDDYEKYIGGKFEEKGYFVIYNGFIKGYEDKGIDIIALSKDQKTINLIQCKNWTRKPMNLEDLKNIYTKLDVHYNNLDLYYLPTSEIYKHTQHNNLKFLDFDNTLEDLRSHIDIYKVRKTLYVASEKVIDLEIGKYLTMIQKNIYRYKDMKIVIEGL